MPTNDDNQSRERAANEAANSDEQAANVRGERAANGGEPFAAQWLTVAEVADLLGVTPRTIQKRCKAGKLDARSVETPTGDQWQINAAAESIRAEAANRAANRATNGGDQAAKGRERSQPQQDATRAEIASNDDAAPPNWKERETELKEQIQWLRNSNEQHQRDAIELRQLLKKALEIAPRQLTQGSAPEPPEAPQNATVEQLQRDGAEVRAALREALKHRAPQLPQESAPEPREAPQTGAAGTDSHDAPSSSGKGTESAESGNVITYDSIADDLEAMLRQRK